MLTFWKAIWKEEKKLFLAAAMWLFGGVALSLLIRNQIHLVNAIHVTGFDYEWYQIALNNIGAGLLIAGSGILLSVPAMLLTLFNGFMLGYLVMLSASQYSMAEIIAALAPHGIFELPAIMLACSVGLKPISWLIRYVRTKQSVSWKKEVRSIAALLGLMIALFTVASLIETYVSPITMSWFK
ncbi:stage II sporulation protein M [Paenibacillus sp. OSY-SE]|uniref:stage II sporulation protein M n=1 Tax=Paenibacillus sp. OSY-SE TaxID=1196323 RepID=UPI0002D421BE|nr:stage II sporulation protein M [Paenibacillus sp. OSY-SE]